MSQSQPEFAYGQLQSLSFRELFRLLVVLARWQFRSGQVPVSDFRARPRSTN